MIKNVGPMDKNVRIIAGIVILGAGVYFQSWFGLLGIVALGTGLINFCPLYMPFGINTKKINKK